MTKLAHVISNVFDPVPMILIVGLFGIYVTPLSSDERIFWLLLFGAMVLIIGVALVWFMRMGYVFDARLKKGDDRHRDRLGVLWITNGLLVISLLVAGMLGRPAPLCTILAGTTVTLVLATIVTNYYKISFHMIGITSIAAVLVLHYGTPAVPVLLFIPIVAWARRKLDRHTPWQIIFGTTLTFVSYIGVSIVAGRL